MKKIYSRGCSSPPQLGGGDGVGFALVLAVTDELVDDASGRVAPGVLVGNVVMVVVVMALVDEGEIVLDSVVLVVDVLVRVRADVVFSTKEKCWFDLSIASYVNKKRCVRSQKTKMRQLIVLDEVLRHPISTSKSKLCS